MLLRKIEQTNLSNLDIAKPMQEIYKQNVLAQQPLSAAIQLRHDHTRQ